MVGPCFSISIKQISLSLSLRFSPSPSSLSPLFLVLHNSASKTVSSSCRIRPQMRFFAHANACASSSSRKPLRKGESDALFSFMRADTRVFSLLLSHFSAGAEPLRMRVHTTVADGLRRHRISASI
jgi:hypothetical protein